MVDPLTLRTLQWLKRQQQPDGSFLSSSSPTATPYQPDRTYLTVFQNALILDCLCSCPKNPTLAPLTTTLAEFLLSQKSDHWSFNYWARQSSLATSKPYPDDLDDTACALAALLRHNPTLIDGTALAKIVSLLTLVEHQEGGPYYTWLVPADAPVAWRDVDLAVNSNVAYFLSLQEVALPNITALVEAAIEQQSYTSPYYPSSYPIIYFISRWYRGTRVPQLVDFLVHAQRDGHWENPLYTALSVSALVRLQAAPQAIAAGLTYLAATQTPTGWPAAAFCLDPMQQGQVYYAGSAALTTAFCLEAQALAAASLVATSRTVPVLVSPLPTVGAAVYQLLAQHIRSRFEHMARPLPAVVETFVAQHLTYDQRHSLSLTPTFFLKALGLPIDPELLTQAAALSCFGWLAYTIYDDFLDGEGDALLLPFANVALREVLVRAATMAGERRWFHSYASNVLDTMERANVWEVTFTRTLRPLTIPDYGDYHVLAHRSLGHSLSTMGMLQALGHTPAEPLLQTIEQFFYHYLIARQLNDDLHDWEKDLLAGHINAVDALLLQTYQAEHGPSTTLPDLMELRELLWQTVIISMCEVVTHHLTQCQELIIALPHLQDPVPLRQLLHPLEQSVTHTLSERQQTLDFLRSYQPAV